MASGFRVEGAPDCKSRNDRVEGLGSKLQSPGKEDFSHMS